MSTAAIAGRARWNPFSAQRCMRRGARLLDRRWPGWHETIDMNWFTVTNGSDCPLGQTYGGFWTGMRAIFPVPGARHLFFLLCWPEWHGFMAWGGNASELDAAWLAEIRARLAPQLLPLSPLVGAEMANYVEMVP